LTGNGPVCDPKGREGLVEAWEGISIPWAMGTKKVRPGKKQEEKKKRNH